MTKERFNLSFKEKELMNNAINFINDQDEFGGIKEEIKNIEKIDKKGDHYPLKDLLITFKSGKSIPLEIQISNVIDFEKYGDIRLDYISAYVPYIKIWGLKSFNNLLENRKIKILKKGKLFENEPRILVYIIGDIYSNVISKVILFKMAKLKSLKDYFESNYGEKLKTNTKKEESWGSAFIPISLSDKKLKSSIISDITELNKELND